jgi:hypothetical protein
VYILVYEQDSCKSNRGMSVECIMSLGYTTQPGIGLEVAREHVIAITL